MASRRQPSTTSTRSWFGRVKHSEQLETCVDEGHQVSWIKTRPKSNPVIVGQDAHQYHGVDLRHHSEVQPTPGDTSSMHGRRVET
ncbi:hypothetical protein CF327_g1998 [Tilletia walkeri]|nr:hypothetical protein CF327_g1998 [Tilletia walkeri]